MIRFLALFLLAATTPVAAAGLPRSFTVTSFDRIRVEAPYTVTLATGRSVSAKAEGSAAALDAIDLRVEGRTLILRQRSSWGAGKAGSPVRVVLSTPELRTALVIGAGSLSIDKMGGLSVDVGLQGSGNLTIASITADRLVADANGSGTLRLSGRVKTARMSSSGSASFLADRLFTDELSLSTEGAGEVAVAARTKADIRAAGSVQVQVTGNPPCTLRTAGSATVNGCKQAR
jgi:hypothetical protein